ncbi:hypothetical protein SAMN04488513_101607 [Pseudozobellia thermophila]|uniref:Uncharacterized protein n=1 Tax=Pseudozobellia thermophila TaxID=192903 RepID=A0A1M6C1C4_9FLAO|nr:hypothetical protein SAMN04488513_101607 [Pseudozobellia thermophila]
MYWVKLYYYGFRWWGFQENIYFYIPPIGLTEIKTEQITEIFVKINVIQIRKSQMGNKQII